MAEREKGGRFFSLEEFVERVPSKVNKKIIERLIVAGAFDIVENVKNPRDRKKLLQWYLDYKKAEMPKDYQVPESETNSFWVFEQKRLTGFGEVDYETMIRDAIPNKRVAKLYVNDFEFSNTKEGKEATIAGKLIYYQERSIKNGTMVSVNIDCNNTIIPVTLWPDAVERLPENISEYKNRVVAISGRVKKDKFKNQKVLYSDDRTKIYIIS